jgi:hypothetical protein
MPKPVQKKAVKKAAKPRKPASDPNRRVHQMMAEHLDKLAEGKWKDAPAPEPDVTPPHGDPFEEMFRKRMSELGTKGGIKSGQNRMTSLTSEKRSEVALKAAQARWKKRKAR